MIESILDSDKNKPVADYEFELIALWRQNLKHTDSDVLCENPNQSKVLLTNFHRREH
jgi:hypothetical protein